MVTNTASVESGEATTPPARDPRALFATIATDAGLIKPGDTLDENQVQAFFAVVEACARIADGYGDPEAGGNAGEHIRFELGDLFDHPDAS